MSAGRKAGLVVLALLLVTTVGTANVVMTSERTVLNAEFVDQSLAEENGYSQLEDATVDAVADRVEAANPAGSDQIPSAIQNSINTTEIVDDAVTAEYIRGQARANLFRLYDFLHGERPDLALRVDLVPLKDGLASAVGDQVSDVDISTLVEEYAPTGGDIPIEVTGERVRKMRSSQSGYQEVRANFRDEVRQLVLDRLVDEAFQRASTDELLVLIGEDPRQYTEAEKARIVDEREGEIRQALRERIKQEDDGRLSQAIDEELAERAQQAKDRVRQQTREATSQYSENVTGAAIDLQVAVIDGLATDTSYEEFSPRIDAAEQTLANEASRLAAAQIDQEVSDNISVAEELSAQDREQLTTLSNRVQQIDTVNSALPIAALLIVGLIYLLTRSIGTTALTTGISVGLVGIATFAGTTIAGGPVTDTIRNQVSGEGAEAIRNIATGLVDRVLGALSSQSLVLAGIGVVLILVWVADRQGYLAGLTGAEGAPAGTGAGGGQTQSQRTHQPAEEPTNQQSSTQEQTGEQAAPGSDDDGVEPLDVGGDDTDEAVPEQSSDGAGGGSGDATGDGSSDPLASSESDDQ
jgi:hypothetical protein